jgi:hypothetical protein
MMQLTKIRNFRASYDRLSQSKRILANVAIWIGVVFTAASVVIQDSIRLFALFLIVASVAILTGLAIVLWEPDEKNEQ